MKLLRNRALAVLLIIVAIMFTMMQYFEAFREIKQSFYQRSASNRYDSYDNPVVEEDNNCSSWDFPKKIQINKAPQIPLDPDRFLYPGVIWGPYNQILGLQHAIYLTIRLNRYSTSGEVD